MSSIVDGIFGGNDAASDAADVQAQSSAEAIAEQRRQFDQTRQDLSHFRQAADPALQQYMALLGLGGSAGGQFTQAPQALSYEDWASRQQGSGKIGRIRNLFGGNSGIYTKGSTVYIPQSMKGTGGYSDYELLPPGTYGGVTSGDIDIQYYEGQDHRSSGSQADTSRTAYDRYVSSLGGNQFTSNGVSPTDAQQAAFASLVASPGQQFIRQRAQRNLLQNASAIGGIGGGNVRTDLVQQGAGFAAQDLENRYSRLQNLITGGQNAAAQTGQFGQQSASNIGNLLQAGGQARASGILGAQQANAQFAQPLLGAGLGAAAGAGLFGAGAAGLAGGSAGAGALLGFLSDERLKEDIQELDLKACFEAVVEMPLKSWRYLELAGLDTDTHLGPMAQEAPDMVRMGEINGVEMLNLHDELMMIAAAIQYMKNEGMLTCH